MKTLYNIVIRNLKMFFKDKAMFFSSLITPMILLVLYGTFLSNVYESSFNSSLPNTFNISSKLIDATVASQLVSSLLAVTCVTVSFCSNLLMIQDKANLSIEDFKIAPVKRSILAAGYYIASAISTLIVSFTALGVSLLYLLTQGWYLTLGDVLFLVLDVFLLTLFGTALSSCINFFLKTNGQASAVGTIVSAGYGFLCGAYMPIASFGAGLQKFLMFLPGTYGTSLIKNHLMSGVFKEMGNVGFPSEVIENIKDGIDCNIYFFDNKVSLLVMFIVLSLSVILFTFVFVLFNIINKKHLKKN